MYRDALQEFKRTLKPSTVETAIVDPTVTPGLIGLTPLQEVWQYLANNKTLGEVASIHRGLEWEVEQTHSSASKPQKGYKRGLHLIDDSLAQFRFKKLVYVNCLADDARGGALNLPWHKPKIICSAARMSRGPWRMAAAADVKGLVASQQFFGIWPEDDAFNLSSLTAILNSPVANAFSFAHDTEHRLRVETMKRVPLPAQLLSSDIRTLIHEYTEVVRNDDGPLFALGSRSAEEILLEIDAKVLAAYDLPPRLERKVLALLNEGERPCGHKFGPYSTEPGALPLHIRLSTNASAGRTIAAWRSATAPMPAELAISFTND